MNAKTHDGGVESRSGLPHAVVEIKEKFAAFDGLLSVTPEYDNGIPGVFENAIGWCSRPIADKGCVRLATRRAAPVMLRQ